MSWSVCAPMATTQQEMMRQRLATTPRLRQVYQAEERPVFSGDRLISLVQSSPLVPPTDLVGSTRYAYLVDEVVVYELVE